MDAPDPSEIEQVRGDHLLGLNSNDWTRGFWSCLNAPASDSGLEMSWCKFMACFCGMSNPFIYLLDA